MSLKTEIEKEIKESMKKKDKDRLRALRSIKSLILLAESEKGSTGELEEDTEMKILVKAAKQRKDSLDVYEEQGRDDLAAVERQELEVIEEFLPKKLTDQELDAELKGIIAEVGAETAKDMGKVMGVATKRFAGRADGKVISNKVKSMLAG